MVQKTENHTFIYLWMSFVKISRIRSYVGLIIRFFTSNWSKLHGKPQYVEPLFFYFLIWICMLYRFEKVWFTLFNWNDIWVSKSRFFKIKKKNFFFLMIIFHFLIYTYILYLFKILSKVKSLASHCFPNFCLHCIYIFFLKTQIKYIKHFII